MFGIYVQSGATATLRGGEIELVSQGFSSGIDFPSSGGEVTVEGTRIVVSTPGNGSGIKALGDRCSVRDADVEVTGGNGADGAYLRCNETSLLATSRVSFAGGGGSASYAVWVGDSTGEASSSGNTITVSTTSCTNLYGMYLEGGRAASTGDSIEVTSTTTSGSLYGVRLETDGGSVSGMNLAVSGAGGTTRGFYLNDPTGTTITGLNGSVTGATGVSGIYVGSTTLAANGLNLHASGTSGTVVGIRSYDDLLVGSSRLLVENTGTGDATAFEAGPGSGERVIVIGSRVDVTAASGTASLADAVNSGGNPDLQFLAGHATGDQDGTDVDCTSSVCPGP